MLLSALLIVAPIFLLVGLGYGVAKSRLVNPSAGNGLSEFVFVLAIPALLFRTVAGSAFPPVNPVPYWLAYFVALAAVWFLAALFARRMGREGMETAIIGFSAGQSNTVMVGLPLILGSLGERGAVPVVLLLVVHLPVTMTVATLLIARDGAGSGAGWRLLRSLFAHPILISIAAGLAWRMTGWPIPQVFASFLKYLGDTAAPCALVAMGMSMTRVSLAGHRRLIGIISLLKLMVHPALVYLLAVHVLRLPPVFAAAAVLFASCPTGINAFLLAERYRAGETIASGAIALSTVLASVTMVLWVWLAMRLLG